MNSGGAQNLSSDLLSAAAWSRFYARLVVVVLLAAFAVDFALPPFFATGRLLADLHVGETETTAFSVTRDTDLRYAGERDISNALVSLLWHGFVALLLAGYGFYQFIKIRSVLRRVTRRGEFIPIRQEEVLDLTTSLLQIASEMGISVSQLSLFWVDSDRISPSILERRGTVSLYIPSGFLVLMASQPLVGRAILAHEFGHIVVGDTRVWLFSVSAQSAFKKFGWRVVLPVILASSVFPILWTSRSGLIILLCLIELSFLAYYCSVAFVYWTRCRSEQVADALAVHFVGKRALADAVKLVSSESSVSHIHLSKQQRLAFIDSLE